MAAVRRSQSKLIAAAGMWSIWQNTTMGSVHRLFVMCLGGGALHMGVLEAVVQGSVLGQFLGLRLLPRLGKTGLVAAGRLAGTIPLVGLVVLAAVGQTGPAPIALAILAYAAMNFCHATGSTGWWPLMQDNTLVGEVGAFFARIRTRLRLVDVMIPIAIGAFLGKAPKAWRFVPPFLLAVASLLAAAWLVRKVRHRPPEEPQVPLGLRLRLAGRSASIRRYLAFVLQNSFLLGMVAPLWPFLLKEHRGMPDAYVIWLVAVSAIGHLAGLRLWAWLVDSHGCRSVLTLSVTGSAAMGLAWLALPEGGVGVTIWAAAYFLLWGFIEGGILMGRTTAMLAAVPSVYQADGLMLSMLALCGGASLGGLAGGAILDSLARRFPHPAWPDPKVLYLAGVQLLLIFSLLPGRRLHGRARQTPTREILALFWQRLTGKRETD